MKNQFDENEMAQYADAVENQETVKNTIEMPENAVAPRSRRASDIGDDENVEALRQTARQRHAEYNEKTNEELHEERAQQIRREAIESGTTLAPIAMSDLPSRGMFYPEGTRIWISPAKLGDIKRWTAMDDTSTRDINEKIQNILESCARITFGPDSLVRASWKDIVDVDRLYILFAIHDQTFQKGQNDILVKINENDDVILTKDNVSYVNFSDKLMKYYNDKKRCFSFPVKKTSAFAKTNGMMDIHIPNLGVSSWLMDYMEACDQRKDNYDRDMIVYANLLIKDWRGLNVDKYYELLDSTKEWGAYEWALISKVRDIILNASINPVLKYKDNGGVERETQLSFRHGFKGIFQLELDIDL